MQNGRIALWASTTDRFVFDGFAHVLLATNEPGSVEKDRLNIPHYSYPPDSASKTRWIVECDLAVKSSWLMQFNQVYSGGAWVEGTLTFAQWCDTYLRTAGATLWIFVERHSWDADGVELIRPLALRCTLTAAPPAYLLGELASSGESAPQYLHFQLGVFDEGTYNDFDVSYGGYTFTILDADPTLENFTIAGDQRALFTNATAFTVSGTGDPPTGNDGAYVCSGNATLTGSDTLIHVASVVANVDSGTITRANFTSKGARPA